MAYRFFMRLVLFICLLFAAGSVDTGSGSNAVKADMPCQNHEMMIGMKDDMLMDCCDSECTTDCIAGQSSSNVCLPVSISSITSLLTLVNGDASQQAYTDSNNRPKGPPPKNLL